MEEDDTPRTPATLPPADVLETGSAQRVARARAFFFNTFEHGMAAALPLYTKWTVERLRQLHLGACHVSSLSIARFARI